MGGKPKNNCYAVIYTQKFLPCVEPDAQMLNRLVEEVKKQPGYIDHVSFRDAEGRSLTVSYWDSPESIAAWRQHPLHVRVREYAVQNWLEEYSVKTCSVEYENMFKKSGE